MAKRITIDKIFIDVRVLGKAIIVKLTINPTTRVFRTVESIKIEAVPKIQRQIAWASEPLEIKIEKSFLFKAN